MKKPIIAIAILLVIAVIAFLCFNLFVVDKTTRISNIAIGENVLSAKEISSYVNNALKEVTPVRDMKIGQINMEINKELLGDITVTYFEQNKKYPTLYYVKVNTKEHLIKDMSVERFNDKYKSKNLEIETWNIDSTKAIEIAKNYFKEDKDFKYDRLSLMGYLDADNTKCWNVTMISSETKKVYKVFINPFTGYVVDSSTRQN